MIDKQTSTFVNKIDKPKDGERSVVAKISTIIPDRDGDVVLPRGMDAKDFKKNPVVLLSHNMQTLPIGKVVKLERDTNGVTAKVQFADRPESLPPDQEWLPDTVFELFKQKILRAFSIGFMVKDMRQADEKDVKRFGDGTRTVITEWSLHELSVVSVPANQEALAVAVSKGVLQGDSGVCKYLHVEAKKAEPLVIEPKPLVLPDPFVIE